MAEFLANMRKRSAEARSAESGIWRASDSRRRADSEEQELFF